MPSSSVGVGLLSGIRVLEISSLVMVPWATQILGDLGADVITIERLGGDNNRVMGPGPHPELSGTALNIHRNKRNVALDIKNPHGHQLVLDLAATCDVMITNLRPGVLARARLDYTTVRAVRDDIIYCQAQGFPSDSDRRDDPAYDDIIQAATGVADAARRASGTPAFMPTIVADKVCALTVAYSVMAGLVHRARTGEGQHIEVPMVDVMRSFMLVEHGAGGISVSGKTQAGYPRLLTPHRRPQETSDGWIAVLPYTSGHYDDLFREVLPHLVGDDRYSSARKRIQNSDFLYGAVREVLRTRTTKEWLEYCQDRRIPASPIVSLEELVDSLPLAQHPTAGAYHHIPSPVRFCGEVPSLRRPAPLIGEDTDEVLAELGLGADELVHLRQVGAIVDPQR